MDAMLAWHQVGLLAGGLLLAGLAGLLLAWFAWMRTTGRKVAATIVGVRVRRRRRSAERPPTAGHAGEMYHAVLEYIGPTGQPVRAETNGSSNWLAGRLPGTTVHGLVQDHDPTTVNRAGVGIVLLALLLGRAGVALVWTALTTYELNRFTLVAGVVLLAWLGAKLARSLKRRPAGAGWSAFRQRQAEKRRVKRAEGRLLTHEEIHERLRRLERQWRWSTPVLVLAGAGLVAGGVYLGQDLNALVAGGERVAGRVIRLDRANPTSSDDTYYPVIEFTTTSGERLEVRDRVGSNPPAYRAGDDVDVLYDPARPQQAMIDRGLWNWIAPAGCLLGGLLLLWLAVRYSMAVRRGRRWSPVPHLAPDL